ncbi:MAG: hypothetical protein WC081_02740 [Candidatus Ratteibacteria bacterium]|jgi:uncharacterized membrane protein YvbJ
MKWKCPHCGNELNKDEVFGGSCSSCNKLFGRPVKVEEQIANDDKGKLAEERNEEIKQIYSKTIKEKRSTTGREPERIKIALLTWVVILITIVSSVYLYNYYHSKERKERLLEKEVETLFNQVPGPDLGSSEADRRLFLWLEKKKELKELKR